MKRNFKAAVLLILCIFILSGCAAQREAQDNIKTTINDQELKEQIIESINPKGYELIFSHDHVHEIQLVFTQDEWDGLSRDMIDYYHEYGSLRNGTYRKADLIYKGPLGDVTIPMVGVRTRGNTTRTLPQEGNKLQRTHLKIKFNETFDLKEDTALYQSLKNRRFCDLTALNLKWNINKDPSQIRELYNYDLLNRAEIHAPKTGSAGITITTGDKDYSFGLYTSIEPVDKRFLTKRFTKKGNDGNLYKCLWQDFGPATLEPIQDQKAIGVKDFAANYRPAYDLDTNEETPDHTQLLSFIEQLNSLEGAAFKAYIDTHFEVDRFLRFLAMNVLIGMPDDYWAMGNNYYLYFNNIGKIEFIPYDYDHGLGGGWHPFDTANANIYTWHNQAAELSDGKYTKRPLVDKILAIDEYKKQYEAYLQEFVTPRNQLFTYSNYQKKYNQMEALYKPYLDNDMDQGEEMINEESVQKYFYDKTKSVLRQLKISTEGYEVQ